MWISLRAERANGNRGISEHLAEGLFAYAQEHADVEGIRSSSWQGTWVDLRQRCHIIRQNELGPKQRRVQDSLPELEIPSVNFELDEDVFTDDIIGDEVDT